MRRRFITAAALAFGLALGGCESFDPLDKLSELDIMGVSKKPLVGDRRPVFDSGVPGVPQGVPPEMVKGYQPPPEAPPPVIEAKQPRQKAQKAKKTAAAPRRAPKQQPPQEAPEQEEQPLQQAPAARTQPGSVRTMPGAQPTGPTNTLPTPQR